MPHYKHIIWDWNGTLFDDTWLCLDIMNRQLEKNGKKPVSYNDYQQLFDFPVRNFYKKIGFDFSSESYESFAQSFIQQYKKRRFECTLHFGVPAILRKLKEFGCEHSVLSAYENDDLVKMLQHFGIRNLFTHVIGLNNHYATGKIEEGKILLEKLGIPISLIVLIGDTLHDNEVAKELGIDSILICNGHNSYVKLNQCGAPVVSSLSEAMLHVL